MLCLQMKRSYYYLLTLIILLATGWKHPSQKPLYQNVVERNFSNPEEKDELSIKIIGNSILGGTAVISITTKVGRTIFKEEFPARYLIGYSFTGSYDNEDHKEDYIKERVDEFFVEENFSNPAISTDEQFDEDYSELDNWNDIKSDKTAIGFYYLIGEEAGCRIAYSKKQKRTLTYFCCC